MILWARQSSSPTNVCCSQGNIPFPLFARVPITAVDFAPKIGWRLRENTSTSFREEPGNEVEKLSRARQRLRSFLEFQADLQKSCKIKPGFETSLANECLRKDMFIIYLHVLNTLQLLVDKVFESRDY